MTNLTYQQILMDTTDAIEIPRQHVKLDGKIVGNIVDHATRGFCYLPLSHKITSETKFFRFIKHLKADLEI